ncbi:MAG TPA: hypothetical protein VMN36_00175 [Verrucomicrobiales bacterium]|nr:hypothetical protein [Verrucomicrobiales bacterium]
MRAFLTLAGTAAVLSVTGCVETEETWTLNPDGSGKVSYHMKMINAASALGDSLQGLGEALDPKEIAKTQAKQLIENSDGIDAWSDVHYEVGDDGKLHFRGTAYFSDLSKVKIGDTELSGVTQLSQTKDGNLKLAFAFPEKEDPVEDEDAAEPDLSDAEIRQQVADLKGQWIFAKGIMTAVLNEMKSKSNLKLPGEIVSFQTFQKKSDREVTLEITGANIIQAMDKMMSNDEVLIESLRKGINPLDNAEGGIPFEPEQFMDEILGGEELPEVVFKPGEPLFDFAKEIEEARKNPGPAFKELIAD